MRVRRRRATAYGWEIPLLRIREVEIHHVDLDAGYTPAHWSDDFVHRTLDQLAPFFRAERDMPVGRLAASDADRSVGGRRRRAGADRSDQRPARLADRPVRAATACSLDTGDPVPTGTDLEVTQMADESAYTGEVQPGGPADVRELPRADDQQGLGRPMDNNAYLLECRATGELCLVDAANDAADPARPASATGRWRRVVTTHRHRDHWQALGRWSRPPARAPRPAATTPTASPAATDEPLDDGDTVPVGDVDAAR